MLGEQLPDPNHCWVRFTPKSWPGSAGLWLDLSTRKLGRVGGGLEVPTLPSIAVARDDVVYLPPVADARLQGRDLWVEALASQGTPMLVQILPDQPVAGRENGYVIDLLSAVLGRRLDMLQRLVTGASAVWPLIGGYTDDPGLWREALPILKQAGVERVQGVAPDLSATDRRRIVELAGERGFEKLFHSEPPSERSFAAEAYRQELEPFLERPLPEGPPRLRGNRALAAELAWIGELWLRLGRPEARAQAFYRASRRIDRDPHDFRALAREENLGVIDWLETASREVVEELVATGSSTLLAELRREYLESESPSR